MTSGPDTPAPGQSGGFPAAPRLEGQAAPSVLAGAKPWPRAGLRPFLELVRAPLTPTAVADSFTGYCLAVSAPEEQASVTGLVGIACTSVLLYWTGMAQNDLFDLERDRARGAPRPLARGRLSPAAARRVVFLLGGTALLAGTLVSSQTGAAAAAILALASLYNAGGKHLPVVGNLLLGACRAGNLLLGALAVLPAARLAGSSGPGPRILEAAAALGLYIAGVTAVSVLEDQRPRRLTFLATTLALLAIPLFLALQHRRDLFCLANAAGLFALLALAVWRGVASISRGAPARNETARGALHPAEAFVRTALSGIFLVDAGFLLASGLRRSAMTLYGLGILAWLWRRRWLQSSP